MPPAVTGTADGVRRSHYLAPRVAQRGDLAAAGAVAVLLAELLLAQLTLGLSLCFVIIGRSGRWRPLWLAAPAAIGLAWMLSVGAGPALAGYLAGGGQLISYLTGSGSVIGRLAHLPAGFGGWRQWLPGQLPVALIVAAVQTAFRYPLGGPGCGDYRPGLIIAARRIYLTAVIRGGELATIDGGCLGVAHRTGRRAAISWHEAESGVLCTGQDACTVAATGLRLASAAIQRRKTVIVVDLTGGADRDGGITAPIMRACADAGAPLRRFGDQAGCYQPLAVAGHSRAAAMVLAMIDWRGASRVQQRFCADYLDAALAVITATMAGPRVPRATVLDELTGLLGPGALGASLRRVPGYLPGHDSLVTRVRELAGQLGNDPAMLAPLAAQLSGLGSADLGRWLRPPAGATPISLARALADREVVLFPLDRRLHGRSATMIARLVAADLTGILAERGQPAADCLIWISGCEALDPRQLTALLEVGAATGTAVLLGTAAEPAAARLAADVNVIVVSGPAPPGLAALLGSAMPGIEPGMPARFSAETEGSTEMSAAELLGQRPDELSLLVRSPRPRHLACCRAAR